MAQRIVNGEQFEAFLIEGSSVPGFNVPSYDYIVLDPPSQPTSIVYKSGGASGTVVASLTLAYDGSGNLISATKS